MVPKLVLILHLADVAGGSVVIPDSFGSLAGTQYVDLFARPFVQHYTEAQYLAV